MEGQIFDIFSGTPKDNPIWIESVVGLSNAKERMGQIAAKKPGLYFVSSIGTHSPIAQIQNVQTV